MIIFVQTCLNLREYFDILEKLNIEPKMYIFKIITKLFLMQRKSYGIEYT